MNIHVLLFDDFETLDVFGPVEVLGKIPEYKIKYVSKNGGVITNAQGARIITEPVEEVGDIETLIVPGGRGTRALVNDTAFLAILKEKALETARAIEYIWNSDSKNDSFAKED